MDGRQEVIRIAKTWLRTPYVACAAVKHHGCDCLTLISESYKEAGVVTNPFIPKYSPQFMLHSSEEKYLTELLKYSHEVEAPKPADIAIWKFGRCFSHAAIVIEWPIIIHAYMDSMVTMEDVSKAEWLYKKNDGSLREVKFLSYW